MSAIFKVNNFKAIGDLEVSGNAGIGTIAYNSAVLTVLAPSGYAYGTILASNATSPAESIVQFRDYNNSPVFEMRTNAQAYFVGNIGIGVNNISARLHVKGNVGSSPLIVESNNLSLALHIDSVGRVKINDASLPSTAQFSVEADPNFSSIAFQVKGAGSTTYTTSFVAYNSLGLESIKVTDNREVYFQDSSVMVPLYPDANIRTFFQGAAWHRAGFYVGHDVDNHTAGAITDGTIRMGRNTALNFYSDYYGNASQGEYSYGGQIYADGTNGLFIVRGGIGGTHIQCGFGADGIFLEPNGFVSIGTQTTITNYRVTIKGVTSSDLYNTLHVINSNSDIGLTVRDDSNVGIGRNATDARLVIQGKDDNTISTALYVTNLSGTAIINARNDATLDIGPNNLYRFSNYGQAIFGGNGTYAGQLTLKTIGGVDNTNVQVLGTSTLFDSGDLYFRTIGGVNQLFKEGSTGNLGVGTTTTSARLTVKGSGLAYSELIKLSNNNDEVKYLLYDNGEMYFDSGTAFQTVKHTSGRWDLPNVVTIGGGTPTGVERVVIKGIGDTTGTSSLFIKSANFDRYNFLDDGTLQLNRLQCISGSAITLVGGTTFTWASGGGITNANLIGCTVYNSDIVFANDYGLSGGMGYIKIGDTTGLSQAGGGVTRYIRYAPLGGNFNASLDRFGHPADGGFTFVAQYAPHFGRLTYISNSDSLQIFSNTGWTMPYGTSSKNLGNVDANTTASVTYTQAEVQEIADRLKETRQVLKSVLEHLGNNVKLITLDNTTDVVNSTAHGLVSRHRVKFIAGTLPAELTLNTYYYIVDSTVTANTFQISATYGGLAIDFTTNGSNIYMQAEYSGMNLLTD